MEDADGRRENPNDFSFKNPNFGHPSHWGPVLRALCVYTESPWRHQHDLTTSYAFLLSLHSVPMTITGDLTAFWASLPRFYHNLTTTMAITRRPYGDPTASSLLL